MKVLKKYLKTIDISEDNSYSLLVKGERDRINCCITWELQKKTPKERRNLLPKS